MGTAAAGVSPPNIAFIEGAEIYQMKCRDQEATGLPLSHQSTVAPDVPTAAIAASYFSQSSNESFVWGHAE